MGLADPATGIVQIIWIANKEFDTAWRQAKMI
jgi:hypothetical protein